MTKGNDVGKLFENVMKVGISNSHMNFVSKYFCCFEFFSLL